MEDFEAGLATLIEQNGIQEFALWDGVGNFQYEFDWSPFQLVKELTMRDFEKLSNFSEYPTKNSLELVRISHIEPLSELNSLEFEFPECFRKLKVLELPWLEEGFLRLKAPGLWIAVEGLRKNGTRIVVRDPLDEEFEKQWENVVEYW